MMRENVPSMSVLVTGACGFFGQYVVMALCQRGHRVRALSRAPFDPATFGWAGQDVEPFTADLCTAGNLRPALEGIDAVIHLAAQLKGPEESRVAQTVLGTRRLLEAMAGGVARRFILASSLSVYDWLQSGAVLSEDSPLEQRPNERDAYSAAKIAQEEIVKAAVNDAGLKLTILRPGAIWGPGALDLPQIGQKMGPAQIIFASTRHLPLTYVENCADAFALALEHPAAFGQTFNVVDDSDVSAWNYWGDRMRLGHRAGVRVPVPYGLAIGTARVAHGTGRLLHLRKIPSILVPCRFAARFRPVKVSGSKLREILHWTPPFSYQQALDRTYLRETKSVTRAQAPLAPTGGAA
jgi:nucleoside-diphosphate-sugar epimerase